MFRFLKVGYGPPSGLTPSRWPSAGSSSQMTEEVMDLRELIIKGSLAGWVRAEACDLPALRLRAGRRAAPAI